MRSIVTALFCAALATSAAAGIFTPPVVVAYDGPVLPRESTAVFIMETFVSVVSIDGRYTGGAAVIQLMPGKHSIALGFADTVIHSTQVKVVVLEAESAHTYRAVSGCGGKRPEAGKVWDPKIDDITVEINSPRFSKEKQAIDKSFASGKIVRSVQIPLPPNLR